MRKKKKIDNVERNWSEDFADGGKEIIDLPDEIQNSMKEYIDYTLTDRALPYVDGLKPVHKAILWCMWQNGHRSTALPTKGATISGEVIGQYWAHSADASYLASAGMTRDKADDTRCGACKLNLSLIDGHGNFGASFEDSPASSRYTEQRLSKNGESCVMDADNGAVFLEPTFDAKHTLPQLAPVRMPILLINGSDGLAYGYNVSWLPHNPSEAIKSVIKRIDKPKCSVKDIMRIMPGPDFPSGGIVIDDVDSIEDAYKNGMGTVFLTSRYRILSLSRGRHAIDIYETPYGNNRSGDKSIVSGITAFAQDNPKYGITNVKNLSGGEYDCLIEVSVKSGVDPEKVARALLSPNSGCMLTQRVSYRQSAVIGKFERTDDPDATRRTGMLKLTDQKPRDIGVLEYLDAFIDFRRSCVINSCEFERNKLQQRKHLIDGLIKALIDIDEVISTIRHSNNKDTAKTNLKRKFKLDDVQADYVLAIPLSRLTRSDKIQLEGNSKKMAEQIDAINEILSDDVHVKKEVRRQLAEELKRQKLPRRTTIVRKGKIVAEAKEDDEERVSQALVSASILSDGNDNANVNGDVLDPQNDENSVSVPDEKMDVYLSFDGKISAVATKSKKKRPDHVFSVRDVSSRSIAMLVFTDGDSSRMPVYELPSSPSIVSKKLAGFSVFADDDDMRKSLIGLTSSDGKVKVLDCGSLTKNPECSVMKLADDASVSCAKKISGKESFAFVTSSANLLRFNVGSVNPQGRTSGGVSGIKLKDNDTVVFAGIVYDDSEVVTSTGSSVKVSAFSDFPVKGRATGGVRCHKFLKNENKLVDAYIGIKPVVVGVDLPPTAKRDASGTKMSVDSPMMFAERDE